MSNITAIVEGIGRGVVPGEAPQLSGLPNVPRELNWVRLAQRFPCASVSKSRPRMTLCGWGFPRSSPSPAMARTNELVAPGLQPSLDARCVRSFFRAAGILRFHPGRIKAVPGARARRCSAGCRRGRVAHREPRRFAFPEPDSYSAYLIFFMVNEDGVNSIKLGLLAMVGLTVALGIARGSASVSWMRPGFGCRSLFF